MYFCKYDIPTFLAIIRNIGAGIAPRNIVYNAGSQSFISSSLLKQEFVGNLETFSFGDIGNKNATKTAPKEIRAHPKFNNLKIFYDIMGISFKYKSNIFYYFNIVFISRIFIDFI